MNKKLLLLFVIVLLGFIFAATKSKDTSPTYITFLYDRTGETEGQDINLTLNHIASQANIDTINGTWGKVVVKLSTIGEKSTQRVITVVLEASEPYWFRNEMEHRARARKFYADLRNALVELTQPGDGMDHSFINRNTYYQLNWLAGVEGNRLMISYSNLIENGPHVKLYEYRDNPREIIVKQDSLFQVLALDYPLPDLTGINIINIHSSNPIDDELHEVCKRFFKTYWTRHGATVELRSDIPYL